MTINPTTTPPAPALSRTPEQTRVAERWFYPATAWVMLAIALYGFRHFYFHGGAYPGRPLTPPIKTLLIVHGVGMLVWILLFILQPTLVRLGKVGVHMIVGSAGALIALVLVVTGWLVGIHAARVNPPDLQLFGMLPPQFVYVPLTAVSVFGVMVTLAIANTDRPQLHRALMLVGTIAALSAAMGRIDWLNNLCGGTFWFSAFGPLHSSVTLALIFFAARCAILRRFDVWLAVPTAAMALAFVAMHAFSKTGAWDGFAHFLMG